ncbi:MAG TPA: TonB family protein [Acetobacteraceae bacterium]|nr:TonB family protein [Acetobacteraceae bacterium]
MSGNQMLGFLLYRDSDPMAEALLLDQPVANLLPVLAPAGRKRRRDAAGRLRLSLGGLVSLLLHGGVLAGLVILAHRSPRLAEPPDQVATVELVLDKGGAPGPVRVPRTAPEPAVPSPAPDKTQDSEVLPQPPVPPPAPPAPRAAEAPTITIGGSGAETNTIISATGPYITPATVDSTYRNRNPNYPDAAVSRAEEGAVTVLIHVSTGGLATGVDIQESSGFPLLDQAAVDAARSWHFLPAVRDGQPVPFDMPFRIVFQLDRH